MSFLRSFFKPSIESKVAQETAKDRKKQKKNWRIEYVEAARAEGKSDDQIRSELLAISMAKAEGVYEIKPKAPKSPEEVRLLNEDEPIKNNKSSFGF